MKRKPSRYDPSMDETRAVPQNPDDLFPCFLFITEHKPAAILPLLSAENFIENISSHGFCLNVFPASSIWIALPSPSAGIVPPRHVLQAGDSFTVFNENHKLNFILLSKEQFPPEALMIIADVITQLRQVLLPVDNQPRIIVVHIIPDHQL